MCGHLFCWPCLHQWLDTRPNRPQCPVCKASISKDKVIPLYGRGSTDNTDPRDKAVPPRPRGQRTEDSSQVFHIFLKNNLGKSKVNELRPSPEVFIGAERMAMEVCSLVWES